MPALSTNKHLFIVVPGGERTKHIMIVVLGTCSIALYQCMPIRLHVNRQKVNITIIWGKCVKTFAKKHTKNIISSQKLPVLPSCPLPPHDRRDPPTCWLRNSPARFHCQGLGHCSPPGPQEWHAHTRNTCPGQEHGWTSSVSHGFYFFRGSQGPSMGILEGPFTNSESP